MAQNGQSQVVQKVAAPQHYAPPTARELRAQTVHRLQIGFSGLATMLLLVALASIIMNRARLSEAAGGLGAPASSSAEKQGTSSDPLADIGVVPAAENSETTAARKSGR